MNSEEYTPYTKQAQETEVKAQQSEMTYEEVVKLMNKQSEYSLELDNLKPQQHNWVDRGLIMTCEGSNHAYHESYKRQVKYS